MSDEFNHYEHGVEITPVGTKGWAIYLGCDGEDPKFHAFFEDANDARQYVSDYRDSEGSRLFEPGIELAIITERGIVTSNSCDHKTHADLQAAYSRAVASERAPGELNP